MRFQMLCSAALGMTARAYLGSGAHILSDGISPPAPLDHQTREVLRRVDAWPALAERAVRR